VAPRRRREQVAYARAVLSTVQLVATAAGIALIVIEFLWGRHRGRHGFPLADSVCNSVIAVSTIGFGTIMVLQGVDVHAALDRHSLLYLPTDRWWTWVIAIVACDLCFYVSHVAMHRFNVLWTVHAVHHQSSSYNLLVGVRVAWASVYLSWVFYLPLAFVGITLPMTLAARAVGAVYQFVLHTRWVGNLGPLSWVLMTPSHHRVHHGTDPEYLDRNYAAIFIVWDRWFGTFTPEGREPRYGTVPAFTSTNPVWANLAEWVRVVRLSWAAPGWREKLAVWFRRPSWTPPASR
jgi:alkylglycerol monooxygenase